MIHTGQPGPNGTMRREDCGAITKLVCVIDHEATGRLFRRARESNGLKVAEVAVALGVSTTFVRDLENGHRNWTDALVDRVTVAIFGKGKK